MPQRASVTTDADEEAEDRGSNGAPANEGSPQNLTPPPAPTLKQSNGQDDDDEAYEAIEIGDDGKPLDGTQASDGGDADNREARLEEEDETALGRDAQGKRPRESHRDRRERQRAAKARSDAESTGLRREMARMQAELETLRGNVEPRLTEIDEARVRDEQSRLDTQIADAKRSLEDAEKGVANALREGDENGVITALRAQQEAFVKHLRLETRKENLAGATADAPRKAEPERKADAQPAPRALPTAVRRHVDDFNARYDWYDPKGGDEDSQIVLFLDQQVARAGFDPATQEYWDELDDRVHAHLPHMFDEKPARRESANGRKAPASNGTGNDRRAPAAPPARRGPMTSGSGDGGKRPATQVKLTRERKEALIQAGIVSEDGSIPDQKKFGRALKSYAEFDARATGAGR